jgi:RNA-directed DNA polymerase
VFGDKQSGYYLRKFGWFRIERHIMVKGKASPDDPSLRTYWQAREARKAHKLRPKHAVIAERQKHVCPLCGESLFNDEEIQEHHKKPRSQGGTDRLANLTLVHLYCQQQIHSGKIIPMTAAGEPLLL